MNNVSSIFKQVYVPKRALVMYQHAAKSEEWYVEAYNMDRNGRPINAHPLSEQEATKLAKAILPKEPVKKRKRVSYLQPQSLLSENVLYVNNEEDGFAIWYTPAQQQNLFFVESLTVPNGKAYVPAMLWKANRQGGLRVFALKTDDRPTLRTRLYYAPFFNVNTHGHVCMGTVKNDIPEDATLESFIEAWQTYFFNSYFSHANGHAMTKTNIVQIWQRQVTTGLPFNTNELQACKITLESLFK